MVQENYGYYIRYSCQLNLGEYTHTIEKLRKSAEKIEFEYENNIKIIMELVRKVNDSGALIKEKKVW